MADFFVWFKVGRLHLEIVSHIEQNACVHNTLLGAFVQVCVFLYHAPQYIAWEHDKADNEIICVNGPLFKYFMGVKITLLDGKHTYTHTRYSLGEKYIRMSIDWTDPISEYWNWKTHWRKVTRDAERQRTMQKHVIKFYGLNSI